jgi:hypothetical protein
VPWFRVDDSFYAHPKRMGLPMSAVGLWLVAGCWASQQLTDGYVPKAVLPALGAREKDADLLVASKLWVSKDDGWQFHDWSHYQPTRVQVMADREAARQRMEKVRARRRGASGEN